MNDKKEDIEKRNTRVNVLKSNYFVLFEWHFNGGPTFSNTCGRLLETSSTTAHSRNFVCHGKSQGFPFCAPLYFCQNGDAITVATQ